MKKSTFQRTACHHNLHVVRSDPRYCFHKCSPRGHPTPTSTCPNCGPEDTIQHRITDCGEGPVTWNWTRTRLGTILRMNPTYVPKEWTTRLDFTLWPPQRHAAVLWIVAHLVHYRLQTHRRLFLSDFMDFLRRSRWKPRPRTLRSSPTGRYLEILG